MTGRQRLAAAWTLACAAAVCSAACLLLRIWFLAAVFPLWGLACGRLIRRWPWTAGWLYRREIGRLRNELGDDGRCETVFAFPLAAPVQRRRRIPREEAGRDG